MSAVPRSDAFEEPAAPEGAADSSFVARARSGDPAALEHLYERYASMVHAIVLSHAPPRDADDLTQEVFARVLAGISTLRADDRVGAWIASIARNVARESLRTRRRMSELGEVEPAARGSADAIQGAREVLEAIRALSEAYRETLVMRLVEGMTGPEIAERTGMTHGSVRVHLHRGMKLLLEELERRGLTP